MRPAQLHTKGLLWRPQRFMKDRSAFPTYQTRVDLHTMERVLRFPLLKVAGSEYLSRLASYSRNFSDASCCVYNGKRRESPCSRNLQKIKYRPLLTHSRISVTVRTP